MAPRRERLESLFPIDRTLVGSGAARFLDALGRELPLRVHRFPSGSRCFDWTVPPAWELERASVVDAAGRVIADTRDTVLSVVNYSEPFRGRVSKADLLTRLHTSAVLPGSIPYRTSYYGRTWGFCVPQAVVEGLDHDWYDVEIDATGEEHYRQFEAICRLPKATKVVSLTEVLQLQEIAVYGKQATGEKYLISPNKALSD